MSASIVTVREVGRARRIVVVTPFEFRETMAALPGAVWDKAARVWTYPATIGCAARLHNTLAKLDPFATADEQVRAMLDRARSAAAARACRVADDLPDPPSKTSAWLHQRRAFHWAVEQEAALLAMDMGCLHGDSIVHVTRGGGGWRMTIRDLHERWSKSWAHLDTPTYVRGERRAGDLRPVQLLATQLTGVRPTVVVTLEDGRTLRCTPDHEVQTPTGKRQAGDLRPGDPVAVQVTGPRVDHDGRVRVRDAGAGGHYAHRVVADAAPGLVVHHVDGNPGNNDPANLVTMTQAEHARLHAAERVRDPLGRFVGEGRKRVLVGRRNRFRFGYLTVASVEPARDAEVFDLTVDAEPHTYVAGGLVVSNTGKSKVAVDLVNAWNATTVLVLAPKSMLGGWRKQFDVHSLGPYLVTRGDVFKRNGDIKATAKPAERIEALERLLEGVSPRVVVTVNYDLAWREPFRSWILDRRWDVGILDEGHRAKAPGGKAGMFAGALRDVCDRRLELTGTPMPHSPLDLYGQGRYLEPALFGTSYQSFKVRYGKPKVRYYETDVDAAGEIVHTPVYLLDAGGKPVVDGVRDEVREELADKLASIAFHVTADEALDLPDELDTVVTVELDAKTSRAYRDLDAHLVAEIGDGVCTVDNALVRFLRLAQITSGHLPVDAPCGWCLGDDASTEGGQPCSKCGGAGVREIVETIGTDKRDALADLLDDLPGQRIDPRTFEAVRREPVVCFARFTHDLLAIDQATDKAARGPYRELSGGRRDALTDDSTLTPDAGVAGVQIQSGAEAVDFTLARLTVYYSLDFSLMRYRQSRARTRRPGADLEHKVQYAHLVAVLDDGTPTIDADVYAALEARQEVVQHVFDRMRERVGTDSRVAA